MFHDHLTLEELQELYRREQAARLAAAAQAFAEEPSVEVSVGDTSESVPTRWLSFRRVVGDC